MQEENKDQAREEHVTERRREFLKDALMTSAYVAPVVLSFAAKDLVKAASQPGNSGAGEDEYHGIRPDEGPGGGSGPEGPGHGNEKES